MRNWKLSEIRFIKANLHKTDKELAAHFGVPVSTIQGTRKRHGLLKPKESGQFKKGFTPWNKGRDYKPGGRAKETQFKKGHVSANVRPVGTVFTIPDATGKPYQFIKLAHHRQYPYARYVWEQAKGVKLTKDYIIRFKDGNPANCKLSNLQRISRSENALKNSNRAKAADSLRKTWAVVRAFEDYGLTPPYKFRTKRAS